MSRHEQERNQTRTRGLGFANSEDRFADPDYSRNDLPNSDWDRARFRPLDEDRGELLRSGQNTYEYRRPKGGDDLFRNNEYYTRDSDKEERKNARLGLGSANHSAPWIGREGTGHFGKGPKGYRRSDNRVKEEVSEALYCDPNIDATEIEVEVKDGTVFLRGIVESRLMKRTAEDCIDHLIGVEDVRNEMTTTKMSRSLPH